MSLEVRFGMLELIVSMEAGECLSPEQMRAFLGASDEVAFKGRQRDEVYAWVGQTLKQQRYEGLKRDLRGLVKRYLAKLTGLSRAQIARLIAMYVEGDPVQPKAYGRRRFPQRYTLEDIGLLAAVDEAHETLSGPATRKLLHRAYYDFKDAQYQRLAELSVAQMYRLRKSRAYRQRRVVYQPTRPTPGYLRVDTVHQGDLDGVKGVCHINAVDEVTQWQIMGATAQISEAYLLPVLGAMLAQFPFRVRGFHSDKRERIY